MSGPFDCLEGIRGELFTGQANGNCGRGMGRAGRRAALPWFVTRAGIHAISNNITHPMPITPDQLTMLPGARRQACGVGLKSSRG